MVKYKNYIRGLFVFAFLLESYVFLVYTPVSCSGNYRQYLKCIIETKISSVVLAIIGSFGIWFITTNFALKYKWFAILLYLPSLIAFVMAMAIVDSLLLIMLSFVLLIVILIAFIKNKPRNI